MNLGQKYFVLDELADIALHSESDSVRDECSSGIRSEAEDEERGGRPPVPSGGHRKPGQLGTTPNHLSLSTTSSLSSCSNTSQARLVQSSLRDIRGDSGQPPAPPPRTSSATSSADGMIGSREPGVNVTSELGKLSGGGKKSCMTCYLSGHSDSLDSVDHETGSTEGSSSAAEVGSGSVRPPPMAPTRGDRDSGIMEDKFDRFDPAGSNVDTIKKLDKNPTDIDRLKN